MELSFIYVLSFVAVAAGVPLESFNEFVLQKDSIEATRVVGGASANKNQFPYQGALFWADTTNYPNAKYSLICGCVLIAPQFVLSAGHCKPYAHGSYQVRLGLLYQRTTPPEMQVFDVIDFVVHPDYAGAVSANDISVIKLDRVVTETDAVKIVVRAEAEECSVLEPAILSGWGLKSTFDYTTPNRLQFAVLQRITNEQCIEDVQSVGSSTDFFAETMLCTGNSEFRPKGVCSGDSGGPLVSQSTKRLIGIVNWSYRWCALRQTPSGYCNVCLYKDFIDQHIAAS